MRYAIVANPKSGRLSMDQKWRLLKKAAAILDAGIYGLDTTSSQELTTCAAELGSQCDVLVVAGGDGTVSGIVNALYPERLSLGYLPMGTGNAISRALGYRGGLTDIAWQIRAGRRRAYDLIACDGKKLAFMASVGLDGATVKLWSRYRQRGDSPLKAYFLASLKAYLNVYRPGRVRLMVDEAEFTIERLLSLVVVKQPYFGLGMKVVPDARWDDGRLHTLCLSSGWPRLAAALATAFTIGNRVGIHRTGIQAKVHSEKPLNLQIDGELGWEAHAFSFEVLPGILEMTH